jgi:hypothetical protein
MRPFLSFAANQRHSQISLLVINSHAIESMLYNEMMQNLIK